MKQYRYYCYYCKSWDNYYLRGAIGAIGNSTLLAYCKVCNRIIPSCRWLLSTNLATTTANYLKYKDIITDDCEKCDERFLCLTSTHKLRGLNETKKMDKKV